MLPAGARGPPLHPANVRAFHLARPSNTAALSSRAK